MHTRCYRRAHSVRWVRLYVTIHGLAGLLWQVVPNCSGRQHLRNSVSTERRPAYQIDKGGHNDDIFFSVLGRGPGSFGVVVDYSYESVNEIDHPFLSGFSSVSKFEKDRFSGLFDTIQQYTKTVWTARWTMTFTWCVWWCRLKYPTSPWSTTNAGRS